MGKKKKEKKQLQKQSGREVTSFAGIYGGFYDAISMDGEESTGQKAETVRQLVNIGYSEAGASHKKRSLKAMPSVSSSPTVDINDNLATLRGRSRNLYMGAALATSAININRTNVVGVGLRLKSAVDRVTLGMTAEQAAEWQRKAEEEFKLWAEDKRMCDATGMNNFYKLQSLVLMSQQLSGDVFVLMRRDEKPSRIKPYTLRLQLIEADRVRTPGTEGLETGYTITTAKAKNGNMIYDGVEVDKTGKVVAYHIANYYPFDYTNLAERKIERVVAIGEKSGLPNILHVMAAERPGQYRGVPYLAHVVEPLLQIKRYTEAEIQAAIVQSFFTAFVTTTGPTNETPWNETTEPGSVPYVESTENEYQMGPGTINIMAQGEDIKFATPTHPQTGFDVFIKAMAQQVGAALEIPATVLLKAFVSNYTASRGELMEAWKAFKMRREWLTDDFCRPVYESFLTEAVARGRIAAPGFFEDPVIRRAYLRSEWIGPSQGQLDPVKEANAAAIMCQNGFSNREAEAIKLGGSEFSGNVERLRIENEQLAAAIAPIGAAELSAEPTAENDQQDEQQQETEGEEQN